MIMKTMFDTDSDLHAFYDLGLAVGNLSMQATALGLDLHQMGGFDREKVRQLCDIPAEYEPAAMIALGYPGDKEDVPPTLQARAARPRVRKPLEELVFSRGWGQAAALRSADLE